MKYVALLRGINVGGKNKVSMPELKTLFQELGFTDVQTYINSGNVIFNAKKSSLKNIEPAFTKRFGFTVNFLYISKSKLEKIYNTIPADWVNNAEQKTDVWFLWKKYNKKSSLDLLSINKDVDTVLYIDGAIVWHVLKKHYSKSGMNKVIGTELYKNLTARNVNTVRKLYRLLED